MHEKGIPLAHLQKEKTARIIHIYEGPPGGRHGRPHRGHYGRHHAESCFHRRLDALGIREGQIVRIISKQPLMGPLTISIGNTQMTIGRGMAHKIIVEEL